VDAAAGLRDQGVEGAAVSVVTGRIFGLMKTAGQTIAEVEGARVVIAAVDGALHTPHKVHARDRMTGIPGSAHHGLMDAALSWLAGVLSTRIAVVAVRRQREATGPVSRVAVLGAGQTIRGACGPVLTGLGVLVTGVVGAGVFVVAVNALEDASSQLLAAAVLRTRVLVITGLERKEAVV